MSLSLCHHCLSHVTRSATTSSCPFCAAPLAQEFTPRSFSSTLKGRGAGLAAALGISIMLTGGVACQKNVPPTGEVYGGPPIEEEGLGIEERDQGKEDSSEDEATDMGTQNPSTTQQEIQVRPDSPGVSVYGGPPSELDGPIVEPEPTPEPE